MTFTISAIDNVTGVVTVSFDVDSKPQKIANLPLGNKQDLLNALSKYGHAYEAGLNLSTVTVDAAVSAMVGKPQTASLAVEG